ncbi:diaminopimelate decarboxylase [Bradymonadaceae bacterium TMQ3]|nr:diaminopimelate decarboxylase [Bradymonadaceae bacterium TMQ3]TXC74557.1 diaminopimelate decarboxylase [Bradymonadales bacterium TMQ1]
MNRFPQIRPTALDPAHQNWWVRDGLRPETHRLQIAGHDAEQLLRHVDRPLFAYDLDRVEANYMRLHDAFARHGHPFQVFFAVKANRFRPIVETLRATGVAGIDAASPREVLYALEMGFPAEKITFTNVSVSHRDLEQLKGLPIMLNCDSLSVINKVADVDPGRAIGLRINPQVGVGINENLTYAGQRATKFGIYLDRLPEALELIRKRGLRLQGLHMHVGCGWTGSAITQYFQAVDRLTAIARDVIDTHGPLEYLNFGGGLGVPLTAGDGSVDVNLYSEGIVERVRQLGLGIKVCVEPGDYIVKDSGVLLSEVVMVEEKGGTEFVGVNTGFNVHTGASHYGLYQEFVHTTRADFGPQKNVTIVGNINEVIDVFAADRPMPLIEEGDILAMLNAGGYGASMMMEHCLREPAMQMGLSQKGNPFAHSFDS